MSARAAILPVFVPHLGCPQKCVFCDQHRITGRISVPTAETVKEALASAALSPAGIKRQLAFYGGSFTAVSPQLQEELLAAAWEGVKAGIVDSVRLSTRPDAVDETVIRRLKRFGVKTVELGAQSMDDEVLRLSRRGHTARDVERAARLLKENGFALILQMMTGLPGDTDEKSVETARRLIDLRPDGVRIYPTVIVRNTELYELWRAGEYREHTVEDAVRCCARLLPLFEAAGIPVIRLGLNPTEELSGGAAAAGAYHPALGELVRSRILRDRAEALLASVEPGSAVTLGVSERQLSQLIGQHQENLDWLKRRFALKELKVRPAAPKKDEIVILALEKQGGIG